MSIDEIEQGKQEDPNNVDEMPIKTKVFDRLHVAPRVQAGSRLVQQDEQDGDSDNHVNGMYTGHCKIKTEKDLCLLCHVNR